ncbi:MAG: hypothetical protein FD152_1269 [Xanthobacteraceae bacterium]|nr:MAG: hypothetical protein FD152_1269 [Xanthobacteraceae bacterium]
MLAMIRRLLSRRAEASRYAPIQIYTEPTKRIRLEGGGPTTREPS